MVVDTLSEKKRYKSCHWGCTFSKGTLLYLKGAYWYLNAYIIAPKMYTLALNCIY